MVREEQKQMNSREKILERIRNNQPPKAMAIQVPFEHSVIDNVAEKFADTVTRIGGQVITITSTDEIPRYLSGSFPQAKNIISSIPSVETTVNPAVTPHDLAIIEIAILEAEFAVAENGAVWLTEKNMLDRALAFICENLVLIIRMESIVPTLHEAYSVIGNSDYEYGVFIAGPSKTADIEQSLVLGAHGPKTLTVFIIR
jgi:L-lactate dehydrogenase complex protein LldG